MSPMKKAFQKAIILPLIVIIAMVVVVFKVKTKPPVEHEALQFPTKTVEVINAKKLPFRYRAMGFGNVEPAVVLKAKTEVSGKISYIHPSLKKGASLAKGTVVLRIEPTTFEFSRDQSRAGLAGSQSSLKQLEVEEKSTRRSLEIAKKNLHIGQKELDRLLSIWERHLIARSTVDAEEQKVLQLRQQVEDLQGKLASFNSRKSATVAQITRSRSQLTQSEDTLGRTEIRLPFDARIGEVLVEEGEYTSVGNVLFEALGTQAIEIKAQLPVRQFYPLLMGLDMPDLNLQNPNAMQAALSQIRLDAQVSLVGYENSGARWHGQLMRIGEAIDPDRDTLDLVVAVNNPYQGVVPGKRPPLLKGMYASVEFFTPAREMLVLPRKALHQGRIYIAKAGISATEKTDVGYQLEIRPVNIAHKQGQLVLIDDSIKQGEYIIITDVIPVMEGMPLQPVVSEKDEKQLAEDALGKQETGSGQSYDDGMRTVDDQVVGDDS